VRNSQSWLFLSFAEPDLLGRPISTIQQAVETMADRNVLSIVRSASRVNPQSKIAYAFPLNRFDNVPKRPR
jgi:hypothetical protein